MNIPARQGGATSQKSQPPQVIFPASPASPELSLWGLGLQESQPDISELDPQLPFLGILASSRTFCADGALRAIWQGNHGYRGPWAREMGLARFHPAYLESGPELPPAAGSCHIGWRRFLRPVQRRWGCSFRNPCSKTPGLHFPTFGRQPPLALGVPRLLWEMAPGHRTRRDFTGGQGRRGVPPRHPPVPRTALAALSSPDPISLDSAWLIR